MSSAWPVLVFLVWSGSIPSVVVVVYLVAMVLQNGYVTGSLFGPGWTHVQEWPHAGPSRLQGAPEETEQPVEDDDEYEEVEEEVRRTVSI